MTGNATLTRAESQSSGMFPRSGPTRIVDRSTANSYAMSYPECEAPTTTVVPGWSWAGFLYSVECSCRIRGASDAARSGNRGVRPKAPVATTTLSHSIVSDPRCAVNPPRSRGTSRSTRVRIRTGSPISTAYRSRKPATSSLPGKCHGSAGKSMPGRPSNFAGE